MSRFLDLLATTANNFRIGLAGVRLKSLSATSIAVRNTGDTADASLTTSQVVNTGDTLTIGSSNVLTISRNSGASGAHTIVMPPGKSTDGFYLRQKAGTGAGVLEFELAAVSGATNQMATDTTTLAFGSTSPLALFTLPANAVLEAVRVIIDTPFNGAPSLSIGITGQTSKYLASSQVDLKETAASLFEVYPGLPANGSAENLIATYAAGGASVGSARIEIDFVIPS